MPFLDELASGIAPASAPDIAQSLGLSGGMTAGAMIVAFHSLAFFVETPLLAWSEGVPARWFSASALGVIACSALTGAIVPRGWSLLLALAVYGPASGCALAVAEGLLVEAEPDARERTMARLSLAANAGDLAVPLLLAALSWCGFGWRAAFVVAGGLSALLAISHAGSRSLDRASPDASDDSGGPAPTTREALGVALSTRPLLGWSFACAATGLLDEVLVAFSALHLHAIGATITERAWAIIVWVGGGFVGLSALERFVARTRVRTVLLGASAATAIEVGVLAATRTPSVGTCVLLLIGVTASTLHPLTKAQAYAALPNRPALVNAVGSLLLPFDMAAPLILGIVAARAGSAWAIVGLLVAPVVVALAAWRLEGSAGRRTGRGSGGSLPP